MFNSAECLICYKMWVLFLFENKGVCESCVSNTLSGHNDLFFSRFSECESLVTQRLLACVKTLVLLRVHGGTIKLSP